MMKVGYVQILVMKNYRDRPLNTQNHDRPSKNQTAIALFQNWSLI